MKDWMTIDDLSDYLQIPHTRIRHLIKLNSIPFHSRLGTPRFFKPEIDEWMKAPEDESHQVANGEQLFVYRGRTIKDYMLAASQILQVRSAWERLPDFMRKSVRLSDQTHRGYLYRKEFKPLVNNYNDYLRVGCQLGLIDNKREGSRTHYYPTKYALEIYGESHTDNVRRIILDSLLSLVKRNMETTPQERHSIFLLWYLLKIKAKGFEPEESHFKKGAENSYYPTIRLKFSESLCDFLFDGDTSKEQEFLERWDKYVQPMKP